MEKLNSFEKNQENKYLFKDLKAQQQGTSISIYNVWDV